MSDRAHTYIFICIYTVCICIYAYVYIHTLHYMYNIYIYIRQCSNFISHCWFHVAFFSLSQTPAGPCRGLLLPGMSDTVDQALNHWVWKLFPKCLKVP